MSDPSDPTDGTPPADDARFDRGAHPALGELFAGLDDLAAPPPDAEVRLAHIARAAETATTGAEPTGWWGSVAWRIAAVAAAGAVLVGGLGADDRLPEPAQRMVSSIADTLGVDLPDGSDRDDPAADDQDGEDPAGGSNEPDRGPNDSGEPDRGPSDSGDESEHEPGSATTGTRSAPGGSETPATGPRGRDEAPRATPAQPADPGGPGGPATPATPATPNSAGGNGQPPSSAGNGQPPANPGGGQPPADPGNGQPPANPGGGQPPADPGNGQPPANPGGGQPTSTPGRGASGPPASAVPADPGGAGEPATPATPAAPENRGGPSEKSSGKP